ncbi:MAG: Gfo/Idh/MocA family oxidoreductase [Tepidisphaeraceae bacterium]
MSNTPIPVAVIGCGRMGRLHARCYSQMPDVRLVGVYDRIAKAAQETAAQYHTAPFTDPASLLAQVKAVTIATPTESHLAAAEPFLNRGIACLIEKPLARNATECRQIADLARQRAAIVQVGHIERFNPIVVALRKLNLVPRYLETTRISPMTFRSLDVGVVLDMMIHDIDIVLALVNSRPVKVDAVGAAVLGRAEDSCTARVAFENGTVATLTASRLAMKTERRLRLFTADAFVSLDYAKKTAVLIKAHDNVPLLRETAAKVRAGQIDPTTLNYPQMVRMHELQADPTEPIRAELDAFLHAVRTNTAPLIPAEAGLANVALAEQIVTAMGA